MPRVAPALLFLVTAFTALGDEAPPSLSFEIELQPLAGTLPGKDAHLRFERLDRPDMPRIELAARARQSVEFPAGSRWALDFSVPGFWGPRTEIEVSDAALKSWVFNLRPAGAVSGLLTARGGLLPKFFDLFGELPGGLRPMSRCAIGDKGRFDCPLPAGSSNLVVAAGTFAPMRFRDARVEVGKLLSLPATELVPGASLIGRVVLEDDSPPGSSPPTTIRLLRFATAPGRDLDPPRPIVEKVLAEDGYFSFVGLEPAAVVLEVSKPGYAPSRLGPLELTAGIEFALPEPLRLARPLDVVVEVDPPADGFGRPWKVTLSRSEIHSGGERHPTSFEGVTDGEGRLLAPGLEPGRYLFHVEDEAGNRIHFDPELWISGPADSPIHVELPLVDVRGAVTLGERPLAARLVFGGRFGGQRVETASNAEGNYEALLPRAGEWAVEIEAPGIETRLTVNVETGLQKRRAVTDIDVPDTEVFGRVVDEHGRAVPAAEVLADVGGRALVLKTGSDGTFETRGLSPGTLSVYAEQRISRDRRLMSAVLDLVLHEGQPAGPIELRLFPLGRREGRVLRPGGQPVPGAAVTVWSRGGRPTAGQATTDDEGRFSAWVDPEATRFELVVMAPGAALTVTGRPNGEAPLDVVVEAEGGELEISWPFDDEDFRKRGLSLRLFRGDTELGLSYAGRWRRALGLPMELEGSDRRIVIPRLAPGDYLACLGRAEVLAAAVAGGPPATASGVSCRSGHLDAGGTLALQFLTPPS